MKVAILVLNYNGKALLSTYLGSVVRHKEEAEVWVVDNGSTDDSLDLVKKNFPEAVSYTHLTLPTILLV